MSLRLAALIILALGAGASSAHPLAPALLQLQEQDANVYSMLWRTSVARTAEGEVMPVLPTNCLTVGEPRIEVRGGSSFEQRSTVRCIGGLAGGVLSVSNLDATGINVVVRVEPSSGHVLNGLLDAGQPAYTVPQEQAATDIIGDYFGLGVQHLLEGVDHLLFIVGLVLLVSGWKRLLGTITAFTLGHSLTLGLATLGYVEVNASLAEAGIALSLLILAIELARPDANAWLRRRPWDMAVGFGLLHGLGFAGALSAAGLPGDAIPAALLGFNLGIEAGQVGVIAVLLLVRALAAVRGPTFGLAPKMQFLAVYTTGTLAAFWLYQRLAAVVV